MDIAVEVSCEAMSGALAQVSFLYWGRGLKRYGVILYIAMT